MKNTEYSFVRDMIIGKKYVLNKNDKNDQNDKNISTLVKRVLVSGGGTGYQEPYYELIFSNGKKFVCDWDVKFKVHNLN